MKDEHKLQTSYNLQNAWYRESKEPIEPQLLQATLAIYVSQGSKLYHTDTMIWAVRQARDLLTTIRMDEADRDDTLWPEITAEMPDELDPNFEPMSV